MTFSALDGPRSSRNRYADPPSFAELVFNRSVRKAQSIRDGLRDVFRGQSSPDGQLRPGEVIRRIFTIPTLLMLLWVWTIWQGERSVFQSSLAECQWHKWEQWVDMPSPCAKAVC